MLAFVVAQAADRPLVGITRQTINAIERDRYDPSLSLPFALADHFDARIEDVFDP